MKAVGVEMLVDVGEDDGRDVVVDVEGEDGREVDGRGATVGKFYVGELVVVESKSGEGMMMWELEMEVGLNSGEQ